MPYKSDQQRRYMHAQLPEIAKRWDKEQKGNNPDRTRQRWSSGRGPNRNPNAGFGTQPGGRIAPGERNPSGGGPVRIPPRRGRIGTPGGEFKRPPGEGGFRTPGMLDAIKRRMGVQSPGRRSQRPKRSQQLNEVVRRQEAKKAISKAREGGEVSWNRAQKNFTRQAAIERRQRNRK